EALGLELEIVASAHDAVDEQDGSLGLVALVGAAAGAAIRARRTGVTGSVCGLFVLRTGEDEDERRQTKERSEATHRVSPGLGPAPPARRTRSECVTLIGVRSARFDVDARGAGVDQSRGFPG